MNSDARRILSQFEPRDSFDPHHHYARGQLQDRITSPTVVVTAALLAVTIGYQTAHQRGRLPPLSQFLWDVVVFLIPARLLFAVDRLVNPADYPDPMLKTDSPAHAAKSEMLRRVLGLDRAGGIIGSVSQVGRKGLSSLSSVALGPKATADWPPGLGNYDNSCYQNSILQGLASLRPLPAYLSSLSLARDPDAQPSGTVDALRDLIVDLGGSSNNGKTLWTPKVLKNMSTWQQQDAQEYYSKLLDQIDKEVARAARRRRAGLRIEPDRGRGGSPASQDSDDSGYHSLASQFKAGFDAEPGAVRNPLEGLMAQRVACVACGYCEGLSLIPFNCLTLSLDNYSEHDVYERLDHYTRIESIEGVECLRCTLLQMRNGLRTLLPRADELPGLRQRLDLIEQALEDEVFDDKTVSECNIPAKFKVNSNKTKQVAIARPPQSLVLHINRSVFDERTGYMFKNSAAVRFPITLDLGPWCLGSAEGQVAQEGDSLCDSDEEQWTLDSKSSMVAGDRSPSKVTGPIYELRAVVSHHGHHDSGHYVCYRRHPVSPPSTVSKEDGDAEEPPSPPTTPKLTSEQNGSAHAQTREEEENGAPPSPSQEEPQSQWWRLSDEVVTRVDERAVLNERGVFMLFYDCVDPNSVLVSELASSTDEQQQQQQQQASSPLDSANVADSSAAARDGQDSDAVQGEETKWTRSNGTAGDALLDAVSLPLPESDEGE